MLSQGRDNYKIWEEGQTTAIVFEMKSQDTQEQDKFFKKALYAQLEVQEYWLFDPKDEWVPEKLQGYRLQGEDSVAIADSISQRRTGLEAELASYRKQFGDLTAESITLR